MFSDFYIFNQRQNNNLNNILWFFIAQNSAVVWQQNLRDPTLSVANQIAPFTRTNACHNVKLYFLLINECFDIS
jgi:hypothetical protein